MKDLDTGRCIIYAKRQTQVDRRYLDIIIVIIILYYGCFISGSVHALCL